MDRYITSISEANIELYKQIARLELALLRPEDNQAIRRERSKTLDAVNVVRSQLNELVETFDLKCHKDKEVS